MLSSTIFMLEKQLFLNLVGFPPTAPVSFDMQIRLIGYSKFSMDVNEREWLFLFLLNWHPVQDVPHLGPKFSWDWPQLPHNPQWMRKITDWLYSVIVKCLIQAYLWPGALESNICLCSQGGRGSLYSLPTVSDTIQSWASLCLHIRREQMVLREQAVWNDAVGLGGSTW